MFKLLKHCRSISGGFDLTKCCWQSPSTWQLMITQVWKHRKQSQSSNGLFFPIHHTAQMLLPEISTSLEPSKVPTVEKGWGVLTRLLKKWKGLGSVDQVTEEVKSVGECWPGYWRSEKGWRVLTMLLKKWKGLGSVDQVTEEVKRVGECWPGYWRSEKGWGVLTRLLKKWKGLGSVNQVTEEVKRVGECWPGYWRSEKGWGVLTRLLKKWKGLGSVDQVTEEVKRVGECWPGYWRSEKVACTKFKLRQEEDRCWHKAVKVMEIMYQNEACVTHPPVILAVCSKIYIINYLQ